MNNLKLLILCSCLSSCSLFSNTIDHQSLLNHVIKLNSPRFLSQTRYISWISWSEDEIINTIEWPGEKSGCVSHVGSCMPTVKDYMTHIGYWNAWQKTNNASQYRIVDILPIGTEYHFYKISVSGRGDESVILLYSVIDSGIYKNMPVYYKYDIKKPIDLHLIERIIEV